MEYIENLNSIHKTNMMNMYRGKNIDKIDLHEYMTNWTINKDTKWVDERKAVESERTMNGAVGMFDFLDDKRFWADFAIWSIWIAIGTLFIYM